ncbi:unnamed protein product, partial [Phaeothamnion confervicola]
DRAEERAKAEAAFDAVDVERRGIVRPEQWPLLFEAAGSPWWEERYVRLMSGMADVSGGVTREAFLRGYVAWLFAAEGSGDDDDDSGGGDGGSDGGSGAAVASGLGDFGSRSGILGEGQWKCDSCLVHNDEAALQCVSCEAPNPDRTGAGDGVA